MSANATSEAHGGRCLMGRKGSLEVTSFEEPAESFMTVTKAQSWRQRIPNFKLNY